MKAKYLEPGDVVIFRTGNVGVVVLNIPTYDGKIEITYDIFQTIYNPDDELLVGRKGQVL